MWRLPVPAHAPWLNIQLVVLHSTGNQWPFSLCRSNHMSPISAAAPCSTHQRPMLFSNWQLFPQNCQISSLIWQKSLMFNEAKSNLTKVGDQSVKTKPTRASWVVSIISEAVFVLGCPTGWQSSASALPWLYFVPYTLGQVYLTKFPSELHTSPSHLNK